MGARSKSARWAYGGKESTTIRGVFTTNGSSAVSAANGNGFSVARSGAGVLDVTFDQTFTQLVSFGVSFLHATDVNSKVCFDAIDVAAGTAQIRTQTFAAGAWADADLTSAKIGFFVEAEDLTGPYSP